MPHVQLLSGAGDDIDTVYREMDTTQVLAQDGSSGRVLEEAMARITITV